MESVLLPFGRGYVSYRAAHDVHHDLLIPREVVRAIVDEAELVDDAVKNPLSGSAILNKINSSTRIAISINDKTRPVPNTILLDGLLAGLRRRGVQDNNVRLFVASGTHSPMPQEEYPLILNQKYVSGFEIISHDCDDSENLKYLGVTSIGTPVYINRRFLEADVKIVVGDIELHHFAGYSGGVKSAAIGLSGRATINANHSLITHQNAKVGIYEGNPLREDIEEIGKLAGIDFALNAILTEKKEILSVFLGDPVAVMRKGIEVINAMCQVPISGLYDVVIASAGGYPKDINLYQAQKAMTHASLFCREGGKIILVAECAEGAGSAGYLEFMKGIGTKEDVLQKFLQQGFSVGPHKAFQIASILKRQEVFLYSSMKPEQVKSLLLGPIPPEKSKIEVFIKEQAINSRIAILPYATACIPIIKELEK